MDMETLPYELILDYRAQTYRLRPGSQLKTADEAVEYANQRGFIFFWPIVGATLPSLWSAVAGDRPVADAHDDPGHVTWGWKDSLVGSSAWYYAKVLRKKATIISMQAAPHFYALSENYGSPDEDYLIQYEQGRMTQEARAVYEAVLTKGPLDTIALRKEARLSSPESESRFNKALADLQADFKLAPVQVTQAGAWRYAFAYDIVARHYPELPEAARFIGELDARQTLLELYLQSVGAARLREIIFVMGWKAHETAAAIDQLAVAGRAIPGVRIESQPGEWVACPKIFG